MKTLKLNRKTDLSHIDNIDDLRKETSRLSIVVLEQENELKLLLKTLPKELVKSGVSNVVPSFLKGKMSGVALTAGTALLSNFFVKKGATGSMGILGSTLKKAGLVALGRLALKWLFNKKK
jgi:hypothetical protein